MGSMGGTLNTLNLDKLNQKYDAKLEKYNDSPDRGVPVNYGYV